MAITVDKASPALTVPQDIADLIVDEIRFLDITLRDVSGLPWPPNRLHFHTHRTRTLQAWSTICRAFVHPCQKHMFYSRQYDTYHDYKAQNSFFADSPHIAALVKKLSIGFPSAEQLDINRRNRFYVFGKSDRNLALFEILRRFPSVQSLTLDGDSYDHGDRQKNWDTIARPLQLSIYHILQLSTLKTLIVSSMLNPPLLFISCLELEELLLFDSTIDTHDIGATHPLPATPNFKIRSLALSGLTYVLPQLLELGITGLSVIRHGSYSSWDDWKFLEASSSSLLHLDISIFTYTAMKFPSEYAFSSPVVLGLICTASKPLTLWTCDTSALLKYTSAIPASSMALKAFFFNFWNQLQHPML